MGGGGGGGGWNPVNDIANGISNIGREAGKAYGTYVGTALGGIAGGRIGGDIGGGSSAGNAAASAGDQMGSGLNKLASGDKNAWMGAGLGNAFGVPGALIGANTFGMDTSSQPSAPGIDPGLQQTMEQQQQQAQQFRANLPQTQQRMFDSLAQNANQQMGQNLKTINQNSNARGLLYSGINQGLQSQERAREQFNLAQGRASINDQLNQAANQMDFNATQTGKMAQQSQQAIQDQIYNQALTNMMNQNSAFGSLMQGAGTLGAIALMA